MSMLPADAHRRLEGMSTCSHGVPHRWPCEQCDWGPPKIWPIRGVRVVDDTVVIKALSNDSARYMCGVLVKMFEDQRNNL